MGTVYDGAHNVLQQLDSFDANFDTQKRKLEFSRKLDSRDAYWIPQSANLNISVWENQVCMERVKFAFQKNLSYIERFKLL